MAELKIRDENYYTIHGWMINRLGLKGIQLKVYAIIYGFSQDGENEYKGRLQYLCDFTGGTSKPTIIKALKELTEKGLLQKRDEIINGVLFVRYRAIRPFDGGKEILPGVKKFNGGSKEILPEGGKEILPPTLQNNNYDIHKERDTEAPPPSPEQLIQLYNEVCTSLAPVQFLTEDREEAIKKALSKYTIEQITRCFELAKASDFLTGDNERKWKATFDWLINVDNIAKVLEGNYENGANDGCFGSFDFNELFEAALKHSYEDENSTENA